MTAFQKKYEFMPDCCQKYKKYHSFSFQKSIRTHIFFFVLSLLLIIGCKKSENLINGNGGGGELPEKPNIILILGDDVGYEVPTCDGGQSYQTPNIDMMAQQGIRFTQCHSSPLCSPSRFMLMTGKYNFRNYTQWGVMDLSQKTIANMLKAAGYTTCVSGKWQFDGGDASIHTFGFDKYCVFNPYLDYSDDAGKGSRYKDPTIYQDGSYLPAEKTLNQYGEDIFANYLMNFIDSNKTRSFFAYWPLNLCHSPFTPPPDNAQFPNWYPLRSNTAFFPYMVKYMDKKIGQLIDKVKSLGIDKRTVIIFIGGDNGTSWEISSRFNGMYIQGGKAKTTEYGTHVPLLIYWPGTAGTGIINDDLIDFTDFLPTIADIANISKPFSYGILDGTSFYPQISGRAGEPRSWIFTHFQSHPDKPTPLFRYVQNKTYKLYERNGAFYNTVNDINEKYPITDSALTNEERQIKQEFQTVLNQMHN